MILDLDTRVKRRINSCPQRDEPWVFRDGYLVYHRYVDPNVGSTFVLDLRQAGIIDAQNHVIPDPEAEM